MRYFAIAFAVSGIALAQVHPLPARQVVVSLDAHYQAVLHDISLTKPTKVKITDTKGNVRFATRQAMFGGNRMERIEIVEGGHDTGRIVSLGHDDTRKAARSALAGWREWVFLFGNKTSRVTPANAKFVTGSAWGAIIKGVPASQYPTEPQALDMARMALNGKPHQLDSWAREWTWAARPVVFSDARCLSCHSDSRLGDAAGILIYALHRDPARVKD